MPWPVFLYTSFFILMETSDLSLVQIREHNGILKYRLILLAKCAIFLFFLLLSFLPVQKAVSHLHWGYDADNYRDMSNVNNLLAGNLIQDPAYLDAYRWYNPLLHWIEAAIVKVTGIPVNEVLTKGGPYLNMAGPVCFFMMMMLLFGFLPAICGTAGFLFLTSGDIPGYFSATYTPWLYPVTFVQFTFYLGIIAMYAAFRKPLVSRFALLGLVTGLAFLGHTAPAVILILQMAVLSTILLIRILKGKSEIKIGYFMKCMLTAAVCFVVTSLPLTWIVAGKYHLHMINTDTWEYAEPIFQIRNVLYLLKANLSVSFFIAVFGVFALAKSKMPAQLKHILYSWLIIAMLLYCYITFSKFIRFHYGVTLPGIVPSFHFFFYIKAVQSVFFGIGVVELFRLATNFINTKISGYKITTGERNYTMLFFLIIAVVMYYPVYLKRGDFSCAPEQKNDRYHADQISVYQWLVSETAIDEVILCEEDQIGFPLLPSGRKMVSCSVDHTNPYIEFLPRQKDRDAMLAFLKGEAAENYSLFAKYKVSYVLTNNATVYPNLDKPFSQKVFSNETFSIHQVIDRDAASFKSLAGNLINKIQK